jgi:hypothetical protein
MDIRLSLVFTGIPLAFLGLAIVFNYPIFSNFTTTSTVIGLSLIGVGFTLIHLGFKPSTKLPAGSNEHADSISPEN